MMSLSKYNDHCVSQLTRDPRIYQNCKAVPGLTRGGVRHSSDAIVNLVTSHLFSLRSGLSKVLQVRVTVGGLSPPGQGGE